MKKRVFVLVDFQNDFVQPDGALTINNPDLINRVQKFTDNLQKGMFEEIVLTADNHFNETYPLTPEAKNYPPHCIHGTEGWKLAVNLKRNIPVGILYKSSTDMWNEAPNYSMLQQKWADKDVYLAGVLTDVCVKQAMDGFLKREASVTLFNDLTQGLSMQTEELLQQPEYAEAVENGQLRQINSSQFFRRMLWEKKQFHNRVISNREF